MISINLLLWNIIWLKTCINAWIFIHSIIYYRSLTSPLYIYVAHASRALQSHDLSREGIKLWTTYILFWPHKDMEGLPGWVISSMPGPPPRQHEHERRYTIRSPIHSNKADMKGWLWRPNDIRGPCGVKFPNICPIGEENPRKTSPWKLVPTGDQTQARCVTGTRATPCSTAVYLHKHLQRKLNFSSDFRSPVQTMTHINY